MPALVHVDFRAYHTMWKARNRQSKRVRSQPRNGEAVRALAHFFGVPQGEEGSIRTHHQISASHLACRFLGDQNSSSKTRGHTAAVVQWLRRIAASVVVSTEPPPDLADPSPTAIAAFICLCNAMRSAGRTDCGPRISTSDVFTKPHKTQSSHPAEDGVMAGLVPPKLRRYLDLLCARVPNMCRDSPTHADLLSAIVQIQRDEHARHKRPPAGVGRAPVNQKNGLYNMAYRSMIVVNKLVAAGHLGQTCRMELACVRRHVPASCLLRGGHRPEGVREYFTDTEFRALEQAAGGSCRDRLLFLLCDRVALRAGALATLPLSNKLFLPSSDGGGTVRVRWVARRGEYVAVWDKCDTRVFLLDDDVADALEQYVEKEHPDAAVVSGQLFHTTGTRRRPASRTTMGRWLRGLVEKRADVFGGSDVVVRIHTFRRTLLHRLLSAGNTMRQCATYLGHRSERTTEEYYYTPSEEDLHSSLRLPWSDDARDATPSPLTDAEMQRALVLLTVEQREKLQAFMRDA